MISGRLGGGGLGAQIVLADAVHRDPPASSLIVVSKPADRRRSLAHEARAASSALSLPLLHETQNLHLNASG